MVLITRNSRSGVVYGRVMIHSRVLPPRGGGSIPYKFLVLANTIGSHIFHFLDV